MKCIDCTYVSFKPAKKCPLCNAKLDDGNVWAPRNGQGFTLSPFTESFEAAEELDHPVAGLEVQSESSPPDDGFPAAEVDLSEDPVETQTQGGNEFINSEGDFELDLSDAGLPQAEAKETESSEQEVEEPVHESVAELSDDGLDDFEVEGLGFEDDLELGDGEINLEELVTPEAAPSDEEAIESISSNVEAAVEEPVETVLEADEPEEINLDLTNEDSEQQEIESPVDLQESEPTEELGETETLIEDEPEEINLDLINEDSEQQEIESPVDLQESEPTEELGETEALSEEPLLNIEQEFVEDQEEPDFIDLDSFDDDKPDTVDLEGGREVKSEEPQTELEELDLGEPVVPAEAAPEEIDLDLEPEPEPEPEPETEPLVEIDEIESASETEIELDIEPEPEQEIALDVDEEPEIHLDVDPEADVETETQKEADVSIEPQVEEAAPEKEAETIEAPTASAEELDENPLEDIKFEIESDEEFAQKLEVHEEPAEPEIEPLEINLELEPDQSAPLKTFEADDSVAEIEDLGLSLEDSDEESPPPSV